LSVAPSHQLSISLTSKWLHPAGGLFRVLLGSDFMNIFDPMIDRQLVRALEIHSARAWPAPEIVQVNGWEVRFTPGSRSRRVNCVTPMTPVAGKLEDTLKLAKKLCGDRNLPCTLRVTPLGGRELADWLQAHGKGMTGDATSVQVAPLGGLDVPPNNVLVESHLSEEWLSGLAASGADEAERTLIARLLAEVNTPQGFARVMQDGEPVAVGRAVVDHGLAGLFHIATAKNLRRQGHGRAIVGTLMRWAREQTAMRAYLQVVAANEPAIALYRGFGFREAYRYDYLTL
jgi:ribosomal protein S18 acetylase RimI-like enzyme